MFFRFINVDYKHIIAVNIKIGHFFKKKHFVEPYPLTLNKQRSTNNEINITI